MEQPSPRQTLSYIKDLLRSRGLIPKSKMGQNFLIDLNLIDVVQTEGALTREDCVLEVGTGTGSLTARMADEAGGVFTVELDPDFYELSKKHLSLRPNVRQLFGDCLAGKNELNPDLLSGWQKLKEDLNLKTFKLVANLPYAVATPLMSNLLMSGLPIERMVAMVQLEMAERVCAVPGTKDYSALTILMQSIADVGILRKIAPSNFWPPPAVDSAILSIKPNAEKAKEVPPLPQWRAFLRDLYTQRRKNLRQALSGWPQGRRDKKLVDDRLAALGIDGSTRAELLPISEHIRLCRAFADFV